MVYAGYSLLLVACSKYFYVCGLAWNSPLPPARLRDFQNTSSVLLSILKETVAEMTKGRFVEQKAHAYLEL